MSNNKDYYSLLGVEKNATQEEIVGAFRKLTRKYHPDLNQNDPKAAEKFAAMKEAYDTLSDPAKRKAYDQGGSNPFQGASGQGGFDFSGFNANDFGFNMEDIFEFFGGGGGGQKKSSKIKGEDIAFMLNISLEDAFQGKSVQIDYKQLTQCNTCHGTGSKDGKAHKCEYCNGNGYVSMQSFLGFIRQTCPKCHGSKLSQSNACGTCRGEKRVSANQRKTVNIPKGVQYGDLIKVKDGGDQGIDAPNGDLILKIKVDESKSNFKRKGADLHTEIKVKVSKMTLGGFHEIEGMLGEKIGFNIPKYTQANVEIEVRERGMPVMNSSRRGNLYVTLIPSIPKNMPDTIRNHWKEIYFYENGTKPQDFDDF